MEAVAKLKNCPISPRKMRMAADLVRGEKVERALGILKFESKVGASYLEKLLLSAISNWQNKNEDENVDGANLYVKTIFVDQGRTLKRLRPAPQGRAHRIRKRSNHVTLVLDSLDAIAEAAKVEKKEEPKGEVKEKPKAKASGEEKKESKPKAAAKATESKKASTKAAPKKAAEKKETTEKKK